MGCAIPLLICWQTEMSLTPNSEGMWLQANEIGA